MCQKAKDLRDFDSLYELMDYFNTEEKCEDYLATIRWNGKPTCHHCGSTNVSFLLGKTRRYKCYDCRKQFSVKVGTIFENSKLGLRKWFMAIFLITTDKQGISSYGLGRFLKISQPSAWHVLHRIRATYKPDKKRKKFSGKVEVDETYYGGKESNKHRDKRTKGTQGRSVKTKSAILGILQRDGSIYTVPIPVATGKVILPIIRETVRKSATIYTDEFRPYRVLKTEYKHDYVNHKAGQYTKGEASTNGVESYWSLFKRGVRGTYTNISKKHLEKYLNEFTFRFNNRKNGVGQTFDLALSRSNTVLDYRTLTHGKEKRNQENRKAA